MRLSAKEVTFKVAAIAHSPFPIRMRGGSLDYLMTEAEALELAHQLADAVTGIQPPKEMQP